MSELFPVDDIQLAAFLTCKKYEVQSVDGDSVRAIFNFPPEARSTADEFFRDGQVSARKFGQALRELKVLAKHSARR